MTDSLPSAAIFVSSRSFLSRLLLAWRDENGCEGNYMAVRQQSYLATIKYELQYFILRPIKNINLIFLSHGSKVHQKNNRGLANMSEKKQKKWHVWLSAVYDCTQEQNGIHVAVSAKKDCWDSGILLPSWRDVTLLFIAHNIEGSLADPRGASLDPLDIMTNLIQGSYKTYNNFSRTFQGPH